VQVRAVWFFGYAPSHFNNKVLKIAQFDQDLRKEQIDLALLEEYLDDADNYSLMNSHAYVWAVPYVTGHSYRLHWNDGLDFTRMSLQQSPRLEETDEPIWFYLNVTAKREAINVTTCDGGHRFLN
jgi:hypothetical protein